MTPVADYVQAMRRSLRMAGARALYFPRNKNRKDRNKRLGREFGFGLESYSLADRAKVRSTLYTFLIVEHSLDQTGVAIDNKDFLAAVDAGIARGEKYRQSQSENI